MNRNIISILFFSMAFTCFGESMEELQKSRIWTSQKGKTLEARLINVEKRWVILENQNHEQFKIWLDDLSWPDQNLIVSSWQDCSAFQAPPTPPKPQNDWHFSKTKDEMTDEPIHTAKITSSFPVHFDFPYDGGSRLEFSLRKHPRFGKNIIICITKGQFDATSVLIRLDKGAPKTFSCSRSSDGRSDVLFLPYDTYFISELKRSHTMKIEVGFYREGIRVFDFRTTGLKWDP